MVDTFRPLFFDTELVRFGSKSNPLYLSVDNSFLQQECFTPFEHRLVHIYRIGSLQLQRARRNLSAMSMQCFYRDKRLNPGRKGVFFDLYRVLSLTFRKYAPFWYHNSSHHQPPGKKESWFEKPSHFSSCKRNALSRTKSHIKHSSLQK